MSDEARERNQETLAEFLGGVLVLLAGTFCAIGAVALLWGL